MSVRDIGWFFDAVRYVFQWNATGAGGGPKTAADECTVVLRVFLGRFRSFLGYFRWFLGCSLPCLRLPGCVAAHFEGCRRA